MRVLLTVSSHEMYWQSRGISKNTIRDSRLQFYSYKSRSFFIIIANDVDIAKSRYPIRLKHPQEQLLARLRLLRETNALTAKADVLHLPRSRELFLINLSRLPRDRLRIDLIRILSNLV